jgi:hypothetical protein
MAASPPNRRSLLKLLAGAVAAVLGLNAAGDGRIVVRNGWVLRDDDF